MRRHRQGNALFETALFIPIFLLLLVGMTQLAKITYTYYTLTKTLYALGQYIGTQQGVNFCDDADPVVADAKTFILTGTSDAGADPLIPGLTPDLVSIRIERYDAVNQAVIQCQCDVTGCDASQGGLAPDFIVVSIPDGYAVRPRIPYLVLDNILLRPQVRVPFGGT